MPLTSETIVRTGRTTAAGVDFAPDALSSTAAAGAVLGESARDEMREGVARPCVIRTAGAAACGDHHGAGAGGGGSILCGDLSCGSPWPPGAGHPFIVDEVETGRGGGTGRGYVSSSMGSSGCDHRVEKGVSGLACRCRRSPPGLCVDLLGPGQRHRDVPRGTNWRSAERARAAERVPPRVGLPGRATCGPRAGTGRRAGRPVPLHDLIERRPRSGLDAGLEMAACPARVGERGQVAARLQRAQPRRGLIVEIGGRDDGVIRPLLLLNLTRGTGRRRAGDHRIGGHRGRGGPGSGRRQRS